MSREAEKLDFYAELVFITVFSLVAANLWTGLVIKTREACLGSSLMYDLVLTVIFTAFAIYALYYAFAIKKRESPPELAKLHTAAAGYD